MLSVTTMNQVRACDTTNSDHRIVLLASILMIFLSSTYPSENRDQHIFYKRVTKAALEPYVLWTAYYFTRNDDGEIRICEIGVKVMARIAYISVCSPLRSLLNGSRPSRGMVSSAKPTRFPKDVCPFRGSTFHTRTSRRVKSER